MAGETQGFSSAGDIVYSGTYTNGIVLSNPATQNPTTIAASGLVTNAGTAIYGGPGTTWTVTNLGTVEASLGARNIGIGIYLKGGGVVVNGAPGSTSGLIAGSSSTGGGPGIDIKPAPGKIGGTVVNYGTITGAEVTYGVVLNYGTSTGSIAGIYGPNGDPTIVNHGVITGNAVVRGTVSNYGTIDGNLLAALYNFGTVENTGTNNAVTDTVRVQYAFYNGQHGLIEGGQGGSKRLPWR
ncbi:MAG TPA: hypothetical protein VJ770_16830 [Stellaceae bacterium]|nr:hypothetical protein [Stellaceae bacterium]